MCVREAYNPKISVIIPIYNVERYLKRCVDSVINQTHENLEIILVDDGSPDNCGKICDEYAQFDSRIKVIHKSNGGLSSARNAGIESATGDFIGFVDSDDFIELDMYEKLLSALLEVDADISICNYKCIDENGSVLKGKDFTNLKKGSFSKEEVFNFLALNNTGIFVIAVNRLYKRSVFNSIRFPERKIHEDEFTAHLLYDECDKIAVITDELYIYVKREGSITKSGVSINTLDAIYAYLERYRFYKKRKLSNSKVFLLSAYGLFVYICENIDVKKYNAEIFTVFLDLLKLLLKERNFRCLKMFFVYIFNYFK